MLAVSNTSPISNLAAIGQLRLLRLQVPSIHIPVAVAEELAAHPDAETRESIPSEIASGWIVTASPAPSGLLRVLLARLHRSEAEAIALAAELGADIVVIDEREGRLLAEEAGLRVTGVLRVLLRAKQDCQLAAVGPMIDALRARSRFFVSATLEARVRAAAGE